MPIEITEAKTPAGARLMRARVSGNVSLADAEGMGEVLKPGQPFHGCLVLCVVDNNTHYSAEGRKYFGSMIGNYKLMGTVVTSTVVRAAINFMHRIFGAKDMRLFNTEAEALAWLDANNK
jgi:hypothetical protein